MRLMSPVFYKKHLEWAIQLIHTYFKGKHCMSSISFGVGGALGSLCSGYVWDTMGEQAIYYVAAIFSICGFIVAWFGIQKQSDKFV